MGFVVLVFQFLPKKLLSIVVGWLMRIHWPHPLRFLIHKAFISLMRIDMSEAETTDVTAYDSIEQIFSRRLKEGCRPAKGKVCSPVDGMLGSSHPPTGILAYQAKGYYYSLRELVCGATANHSFVFEPAWYMNFYLAPHNYHRVHSPIAGQLTMVRAISGELWPVQQRFRNAVTRLYVRNERKVFHFHHPKSGGQLFLVMVAAFGVGNMTVTALQEQNDGDTLSAQDIKLGEELAYFSFGSTVILLFDKLLANKYNLITTGRDLAVTAGTSLLKG